MKQKIIEINGLKWDIENLELNGQIHFTHEDACDAAQSAGKRLSTKEEWEALCDLGSTWDSKRKGRWFGSDHELKKQSKESLFLPAAGIRHYYDATLSYEGTSGYYWSSTVGCTGSYHLYFDSGFVLPDYYSLRAFGLSCRCVSE